MTDEPSDTDWAWAAGVVCSLGVFALNLKNGRRFVRYNYRRTTRLQTLEKLASILDPETYGKGQAYSPPGGYISLGGEKLHHAMEMMWPYLSDERKADYKAKFLADRATRPSTNPDH